MRRSHDPGSKPRLRRNLMVNLAGLGLPLVAALFAVPPLLAGLGEVRFGVLALAWALVSYFGLFDLGVGRALTQGIARRLDTPRERELPALMASGMLFLLVLGLLSGVVLALLAPWLTRRVLTPPPEMLLEVTHALRLLAATLPFVLLNTGLRAILEARQNFVRLNVVRLPMAVLIFAGPLLILPFSQNLVPVIAILAAARLGALAAFAVFVRRLLRELSIPLSRLRPQRDLALDLLKLGGWMTVSNLVAPLLLYLDRFLISGLLSLTAVTYYVTPFEVISRLSVLPNALMAVLFPAFTTALIQEPRKARRLYRRSLLGMAALMAPLAAAVLLGARPGLTLWLGEDFAAASFRAAQLLAAGAFFHALAQPSFHLLQAAGRADLTAKLHLAETPVYVAYLFALTARFGIVGTAGAWLLRVLLSSLALAWLAHRAVLKPQEIEP
ncbi:MAG: flippase [Acidobacteriota bacterium]|nr:flippase [Acidobacteriota bacterium]